MATLFTTTRPSLLFVPSVHSTFPPSTSLKPNSLSFSSPHHRPKPLRFSKTRSSPSPQPFESDSEPEGGYSVTEEWGENPVEPLSQLASSISDEWGEKSESVAVESVTTRFAESDPPRDEDEWEEREVVGGGGDGVDKTWELKRCLADTVYGTELGFRAGSEVRAEVLEIVNQLEAMNPTPAPVENPELLDGNWVLLYTAFSELLPLLAAGSTPLLKVKSISQSIDTNNLSIDNSTTLSSPFADFSFSATASFEVRSPSRIEVSFKEGTLKPPEIKSSVDLPESVGVFGQEINLSFLKQSLNPLQDVAANISRAISGQPPLKLPFPGNRGSSWLLTTYLDKDLRISRGDGGLFVLAREGSSLLEL
ncbi:unnamed protein product [Eruca vesicaria subsp. sativa]|uniref:Plastid lipid-associated protein/fibrillin conserved domain-containing protein n=1 Tax=Eruca vesicaria subsp. sativa TaxID=29727 RepID=A0ABC8KGW4_ERUVS|nr:unnamed protein product [Eruca vesicaria subsp. sativa]